MWLVLDQPEIVKVFQCRTLIENSQLTVLFVSCVCLIQVFLLAAGARKNTARFNCKLHAYTLNCHLSRFPVITKSSLHCIACTKRLCDCLNIDGLLMHMMQVLLNLTPSASDAVLVLDRGVLQSVSASRV